MKRRNNKVTVRLTNAEKQHLEKQAYATGMNMEQFIRNLISGSNLRERPSEYWKEVVSQLSAIGNNINQLTRLANEKIITVINLKELRMEVNNIWQLLKQLVQKQT